MGLFVSRTGSLGGLSWGLPQQVRDRPQSRDVISVRSSAKAVNEVRNLGRPVVTMAVARNFGPVVSNARAEWPIDSGESRDDMFIEVETDGSTMGVSYGNDSDYAAFIRDGETMIELLVIPGAAALDRAIDDILNGITNG